MNSETPTNTTADPSQASSHLAPCAAEQHSDSRTVAAETPYKEYIIENGYSAPGYGAGGRSTFPFGTMAVGESVVLREVSIQKLDQAIEAWRRRKNIDLGRVYYGDGFRVFRRS